MAEVGTSNDTLQEIFTNEPINLIGQSNKYLFKYNANGWHNDSFADDFMNYFVKRGSNSISTSADLQRYLEAAGRCLFKAFRHLAWYKQGPAACKTRYASTHPTSMEDRTETAHFCIDAYVHNCRGYPLHLRCGCPICLSAPAGPVSCAIAHLDSFYDCPVCC
jgi:hypothetical protein